MANVNNNHLALATHTTELPGLWLAVGPGACYWACLATVFAPGRGRGPTPAPAQGHWRRSGPGPRPARGISRCQWRGPFPVGQAGPRSRSLSRSPSLPARACWPAGRLGAEAARPRAGWGGGRDMDIRDMGIRDLTAPRAPPGAERLPGGLGSGAWARGLGPGGVGPGAWARGRTLSPSRNRMPRNAQRQWQWQWQWARLE